MDDGYQPHLAVPQMGNPGERAVSSAKVEEMTKCNQKCRVEQLGELGLLALVVPEMGFRTRLQTSGKHNSGGGVSRFEAPGMLIQPTITKGLILFWLHRS